MFKGLIKLLCGRIHEDIKCAAFTFGIHMGQELDFYVKVTFGYV